MKTTISLTPPAPMTGRELKLALESLEMTQGALAVYLGTADSSVSQWTLGKRKVPRWAVAFIRVALAATAAGVSFEKARGRGRPSSKRPSSTLAGKLQINGPE